MASTLVVLAFRVGTAYYATPLADVPEMHHVQPTTPLVIPEQRVVGLAFYRGRITPVVSGEWLLRGDRDGAAVRADAPPPVHQDGRFLYVDVDDARIAVYVDELIDTVTTHADAQGVVLHVAGTGRLGAPIVDVKGMLAALGRAG